MSKKSARSLPRRRLRRARSDARFVVKHRQSVRLPARAGTRPWNDRAM